MGGLSEMFLGFIDHWGYFAVALLMGMENACIPIPSELILGFAGYLVFAGRMTFWGALWYGMLGGILGSWFAYEVGRRGGRAFVDRYGHYFFIKRSHVDRAQNWFDRYGLKAVFFSRMLPVIRTFISLPVCSCGSEKVYPVYHLRLFALDGADHRCGDGIRGELGISLGGGA